MAGTAQHENPKCSGLTARPPQVEPVFVDQHYGDWSSLE